MIEINGTYYAKNSIKAICKVLQEKHNGKLKNVFYFEIKIALGNYVYSEIEKHDSLDSAEQSRKQLIEQLNK